MSRFTHVLARLVSAAALASLGTGGPSSTAQAQQPDAKQLRLQLLSVGGVAYQLIGAGGSSVVLIRENDVVLVDSKPRGWGKAVIETIGRVTDLPVTAVINTHADFDQVGGQLDIPSVTTIVAHENAASAMRAMPEFAGAGARALPNKTVGKQLSLFEGPDRVDLYYFGAGHTNGDLVVVFPEIKVAYLGDLFPGKMLPVIDSARGGSMLALVDTLAAVVREVKDVDRVLGSRDLGPPPDAPRNPFGHLNSWSDLVEYAAFNRDFVAAVKTAKADGKNPEQALAGLPLAAKYPGYDLRQARANIDIVYRELDRATGTSPAR